MLIFTRIAYKKQRQRKIAAPANRLVKLPQCYLLIAHSSIAWLRASSLIGKETLYFERKRGMDFYLKEKIGQD
jgi:hypothetical protein